LEKNRERIGYNSEKSFNNLAFSERSDNLKEDDKMDRKSKALILLTMVAVSALLGGIALTTYAADNGEENSNGFPEWFNGRMMAGIRGVSRGGPRGWERGEFGFPFDLTDEQRAEIRQIVGDMREAGASREEIKAAIDAKLEEWGIEAPQCRGPDPQGFRGAPPPWWDDLTEEQREEIRQVVENMSAETRTKIDAKLEEWGVEVPGFQGPPPPEVE